MLPRMVVALFSALILLAFGASTAFATPPECRIGTATYPSDPQQADFWYAQIDANASSGSLATEGVRGELTINGGPSNSNPNNQHVALYVGAHEGMSTSQLQVGWITGLFGLCPSQGTTSTGTTIKVYVEIYDDTASSGGNYCYISLFETAPWGASYEVAYAGVHEGRYQYRTYYQGTGEQIQYLGWGDYNSLYLSPSAVGEVYSPLNNPGTPNATPQTCPILGQNSIGHWNELGYSPSATFASVLQIYNGSSWVNWPAGSPPTTTVTHDPPYQLEGIPAYTKLANTGGQ